MLRSSKFTKAPSKTLLNSSCDGSSINLVTWKEVKESNHCEAEQVVEKCLSDFLRNFFGFVGGGYQGKSSCSIIPFTSEVKDLKMIEDPRLVNWKRWLYIRDKESVKITNFTYRRRKDLLLNANPNDYRRILNRKATLDKSATCFGALNFWKLPEKSRKDLLVTLPKSEKVDSTPEIIYTQTPDLILKEQKILKNGSQSQALKLIEDKLEQQVKIFDPLMDHIALKGNVTGDGLKCCQESSKRLDSIQLSQNYEKFQKVERQQMLIVDGIKVSSDFPDKNVLIDLVFKGVKIQRQTKFIRFENGGEIAINLTFKKAPDPQFVRSRLRSFFCNKSTFRVIPGDVLDFPLHFYPIKVGIFHEKWIVSCFPEFSSDCKICINLFGHCSKKHININDLMRIESEIDKKVAELAVEQAIKDLMTLTTRECKLQKRELFIDPQVTMFTKMNPKLFYQLVPVENLKQIYEKICEDKIDWNFDVDGLYKMIMEIVDPVKKKEIYEVFMENFNQLRNFQPNPFGNDEKSTKFLMVRNVAEIFFENFDDIMNNGCAKCYQEKCIKSSLHCVVNKMICIIES